MVFFYFLRQARQARDQPEELPRIRELEEQVSLVHFVGRNTCIDIIYLEESNKFCLFSCSIGFKGVLTLTSSLFSAGSIVTLRCSGRGFEYRN